MTSSLFYRCEMRHEEFQMSSINQGLSPEWKRNDLCAAGIRRSNVFCSHGTALSRVIREIEPFDSATQSELLELQNQLYFLDHQKGELEKYVFENEEVNRNLMKEVLRLLIQDYHRICDRIEILLFKKNEDQTKPDSK